MAYGDFVDPNSGGDGMDWYDMLKKAGPGLLNLGAGIYSRNATANENAQRLNTAQGPNFNALTQAQLDNIKAGGNFDPTATAASRFQQQQNLVQPVQQKQVDDLTRSLYARGMLGSAVYNPGLPGVAPDGKTSMNPELAALFAAHASANSQAAYDSMNQGQQLLNNLTNRASTLGYARGGAQQTGITGQMTQSSPAANNAKTIGAIGSIFQSNPGMLGKGLDWLGGKTGWWGGDNGAPGGTTTFNPGIDATKLNQFNWGGEGSGSGVDVASMDW